MVRWQEADLWPGRATCGRMTSAGARRPASTVAWPSPAPDAEPTCAAAGLYCRLL